MARARNIKPGFFQNEQLGELSPITRLAFIAMWTIADYRGCIEFRPKRLKVQLLPYDECDIEEIAINLDKSGLVRIYSVQGQRYIKVLKFELHQNPHKNERESGSEIPDYEEKYREINELQIIQINREENGTAPADSLLLIPDSLLLIPDCTGTPQAAAPAKPKLIKRSQKIPMPDGFTVSDAVKIWAAEKQYDQLERHLESFIAKSRANGYQYVNWDSAFMNAITDDWAKIRSIQRNGIGGTTAKPSRHNGFEKIDYSEGVTDDGRI